MKLPMCDNVSDTQIPYILGLDVLFYMKSNISFKSAIDVFIKVQFFKIIEFTRAVFIF